MIDVYASLIDGLAVSYWFLGKSAYEKMLRYIEHQVVKKHFEGGDALSIFPSLISFCKQISGIIEATLTTVCLYLPLVHGTDIS